MEADDLAHAEPSAKQQADDQTFFLRMLKPFTRYQPDIDALRTADARVVIATGQSSTSEIAARSTLALAEQLGVLPSPCPVTTVASWPNRPSR